MKIFIRIIRVILGLALLAAFALLSACTPLPRPRRRAGITSPRWKSSPPLFPLLS